MFNMKYCTEDQIWYKIVTYGLGNTVKPVYNDHLYNEIY